MSTFLKTSKNEIYYCGYDRMGNITIPTLLKCPNGYFNSLACGFSHVLALTSKKELYVWDKNNWTRVKFASGYKHDPIENQKYPISKKWNFSLSIDFFFTCASI